MGQRSSQQQQGSGPIPPPNVRRVKSIVPIVYDPRNSSTPIPPVRPDVQSLREMVVRVADWSYEATRLGTTEAALSFEDRIKILVFSGHQRCRYILKRVSLGSLIYIYQCSLLEDPNEENFPPDADLTNPPIGKDLFIQSFVDYLIDEVYWRFERRKEEMALLRERQGEFLTSFVELRCPFELDLPMHLLREILSFVPHNFETLSSVGLVSETFFYAFLSTWVNLHVPASKMYAISPLATRSAAIVTFGDCEFIHPEDVTWLLDSLSPLSLRRLNLRISRDHIWQRFTEALTPSRYTGPQFPNVDVIDFGYHRHPRLQISDDSKLCRIFPNVRTIIGMPPSLSLLSDCQFLETLTLSQDQSVSVLGTLELPSLSYVTFLTHRVGKGFRPQLGKLAQIIDVAVERFEGLKEVKMILFESSRRRHHAPVMDSGCVTLVSIFRKNVMQQVQVLEIENCPLSLLPTLLSFSPMSLRSLSVSFDSSKFNVDEVDRDQGQEEIHEGHETWRDRLNDILWDGLMMLGEGKRRLEIQDVHYWQSEYFQTRILVNEGEEEEEALKVMFSLRGEPKPYRRYSPTVTEHIQRQPQRFDAFMGLNFLFSLQTQPMKIPLFRQQFPVVEIWVNGFASSSLVWEYACGAPFQLDSFLEGGGGEGGNGNGNVRVFEDLVVGDDGDEERSDVWNRYVYGVGD